MGPAAALPVPGLEGFAAIGPDVGPVFLQLAMTFAAWPTSRVPPFFMQNAARCCPVGAEAPTLTSMSAQHIPKAKYFTAPPGQNLDHLAWARG